MLFEFLSNAVILLCNRLVVGFVLMSLCAFEGQMVGHCLLLFEHLHLLVLFVVDTADQLVIFGDKSVDLSFQGFNFFGLNQSFMFVSCDCGEKVVLFEYEGLILE